MKLAYSVLIGLCLCLPASAQLMTSDKMNPMDHGVFASSTISTDPYSDGNILAYKGIAVKVGTEESPATLVFDTDLLRVAGAWTGGFLHWYPARTSLQEFPSPGGFMHSSTSQAPGWSHSKRFDDPRRWPYGPIPEALGRYNGLYIHGDRVLVAYSVAGSEVLESPGFSRVENHPVFTRTFKMSPTEESLSLRIMQAPETGTAMSPTELSSGKGYVAVQSGGDTRMVGYQEVPQGAEWHIIDHHLVLELPPAQEDYQFSIAIGPVLYGDDGSYMEAHLKEAQPLQDLESLRLPGPSHWEPVETKAVMGDDEGPFVVDELTLPFSNPWNSYLRLSGVDFLSDGRAVVTSLSGDVWLVSGIDERLGTLEWKRYATGLNQPLGVKVVDDMVYVTGRDQITRLHDLNGDGEADFYENFNNEVMAATNFHAFTMNLETDAEGNFYFAKSTPWPPHHGGSGPPRAAEITPHHGVLFKLSPDGRDLDVIATGLRNPNGLSISPDGEMVYPDNQGNWVPTSNVIRIKEGGFHGFVPSAQHIEVPDKPIEPVIWLPHQVDNSPGSPIWITSDSWPEALQGQLALTSYGKANLSLLLTEEVDGVMQGGLLNLPLEFKSGTMRGRFHEDGHLYIAGLTSWQSNGQDDGSLHRVRYTGEPLHMPTGLHVKANGIEITFSEPVDPRSVVSENFNIEQWNYRWFESYGSPAYSVKNPDELGSDEVEVHSVQLSDDRKTVFIEIPGIQPVMGMSISYSLKTSDGVDLEHDIYNTINRVPGE